MIDLLRNNLVLLFEIVWICLLLAAALAPLETMGWWAGWWFREEDENDANSIISNEEKSDHVINGKPQYYVVFLTGIGGATDQVNVPMEVRLIERLRTALPEAQVFDRIYPYSVDNLSLTEDRLLSPFWRFVLKEKMQGQRAVGFLINLRNILQMLVCADDRYGAFFSQGTSHVITMALKQAGYAIDSQIPIVIIGYSGGAQIATGAAAYLKQALSSHIEVISLGGVMSSVSLMDRIDRITHIYSNQDTVQRLGMIFPGRWRISFLSAWNKGRRAGRIQLHHLRGMKHDGKGGYLDEQTKMPDGTSYLDQTVETIVGIIHDTVGRGAEVNETH